MQLPNAYTSRILENAPRIEFARVRIQIQNYTNFIGVLFVIFRKYWNIILFRAPMITINSVCSHGERPTARET